MLHILLKGLTVITRNVYVTLFLSVILLLSIPFIAFAQVSHHQELRCEPGFSLGVMNQIVSYGLILDLNRPDSHIHIQPNITWRENATNYLLSAYYHADPCGSNSIYLGMGGGAESKQTITISRMVERTACRITVRTKHTQQR